MEGAPFFSGDIVLFYCFAGEEVFFGNNVLVIISKETFCLADFFPGDSHLPPETSDNGLAPLLIAQMFLPDWVLTLRCCLEYEPLVQQHPLNIFWWGAFVLVTRHNTSPLYSSMLFCKDGWSCVLT